VGLSGWNVIYSLLPFRTKLALPLGQVEAEVFDIVLANLGLFPRDCILPPIKEKGGGMSLPYSPPELASQQEVIYVLEGCAAVLVVRCQDSSKNSG
jgi:hypothetical protein